MAGETHRYDVDDEVTTVMGVKAKILERLPVEDGVASYKVETSLGVAYWPDDALV